MKRQVWARQQAVEGQAGDRHTQRGRADRRPGAAQQTAKVPIITEADLEYFQKPDRHPEGGGALPVPGTLPSGREGRGSAHVACPRRADASVGDVTFYSFLISPHELLRIAYISHMGRTSNDDLATYQRMVKPARLKDDRSVHRRGWHLSDQHRREHQARWVEASTSRSGSARPRPECSSLPGQYGSAWIIDGQHRLIRLCLRWPRRRRMIARWCLCSPTRTCPARAEIEMFVDINTQAGEGRPQSRQRADLESQHRGRRSAAKRLEAICARVGAQHGERTRPRR